MKSLNYGEFAIKPGERSEQKKTPRAYLFNFT